MKKLSYAQWLTWVFDHPVRKKAWYWALDIQRYDRDAQQNVDYLTRLFNDPLAALAPYTDQQINQGLWFIADSSCSSHLFCLNNDQIHTEARIACIQAFDHLYAQLFAAKCSNHLGHLSEVGEPLNPTCYMWWDIAPVNGLEPSKNKRLHQAMLQVMANALKIKNDACIESALHGLGHWYHYYPNFTQRTIKQFLAANPRLRPELKDYAMAALKGCVL